MKFEFNEAYCYGCEENTSAAASYGTDGCSFKGSGIAKCIYEQAVNDMVLATNLLKSAQRRREEMIYKLIEEQNAINLEKKILDDAKLLIEKMKIINEGNES